MKILKYLLLPLLAVGSVQARACPTDRLESLVGEFTGVASIVTVDSKFALRKPNPIASTTIANKSKFELAGTDTCNGFEITIDYLKPKIASVITGSSTAREVKFLGSAEDDGTFTLSNNGEKKGHLRQIDDHTFLAEFVAPNPLDPKSQTFCREFITVNSDKNQIVRTIQVFDLSRTKLVQYRLVKEQRSLEREPNSSKAAAKPILSGSKNTKAQ
jgi:hypothetical protein